MTGIAGRTVMVVGASRGLGAGVAAAFASAGADVLAVARDASALEHSAPGVTTEVADATDADSAVRLLRAYEPSVLVLVAGAKPYSLPLQEQTWETFSVNWHTDVKIAFEWLGAALRLPLPASSEVIVFSSGAAVNGSPLSGGYAGSKATQRFITRYAQDESQRADLGISFTTVLPQITPATGLGLPAVQAYAARSGQTIEEYVTQLGEPLTPEIAGASITQLVVDGPLNRPKEFLLTGAGLRPLP